MLEITLANLKAEVARAESERIDDKNNHRLNTPAPNDLPEINYDFIHTEDPYTFILTCQNQRDYQEDRAGLVFVDRNPADSVINNALLLFNTVEVLSHCLKNEKAGSTLVLNLSWQDETHTHLLVANVGDSRSTLCNLSERTATRLTCDHTLLRENERETVVSRGYKILMQYNEMIITAKETNKIVGIQKNSHLYTVGEDPRGLQMTRSLGDSPLHNGSEVFNRRPGLSYITAPRSQRCYLVTSSDGVTDFVADEQLTELLVAHKKRSVRTKLLKIAQTAIGKGSKDNVTSVLSWLGEVLPEEKMRLHFVADGHSGKASSEFIQSNMKECFVLATRLREEYLRRKATLMPRELRYLENIFHFVESGLLTFNEGISFIDQFHSSEKYCKHLIQNLPNKSVLHDYLSPSMLNDTEIKSAFDKFKSGEITATEALFLFLKRLPTLYVNDDKHEFLFKYRRKQVVLCDTTAPEFVKGLHDSTSVLKGINAISDIISARVQGQNARVQKVLGK